MIPDARWANISLNNYMSKDVWKKYVTSISALDFMNTAWNNPRIMKKRKRKGGGGGNHGSTQPKAVHTGSFFTEGYWRIPVRHYLGLDQGTGSGGGEK